VIGGTVLLAYRRELPAPHITAARLALPRLAPDLLPRTQLIARLAGWETQRVTCLTAPAGFGKTTLAAQLLHSAQQPPQPLIAWLTAARDDDDPLRFAAALSSALQVLLLPDDAADISTALLMRRAEAAFRLVLTVLARQTVPSVVVIDDLHQLRHATVLEWLARAIEQSSSAVRWLLLSRREPPAELARVRLAAAARDLDGHDLRVTRAELTTLLWQGIDQPPDEAIIDQLEARTQGWFAAVQLARSFLKHSDGDRLSALQRLPARLQDRRELLVAYLGAEVLAQLPDELATFLLQCAPLPYLQPELCAAVTGHPAAARLLQQLLQEQLLISALDQQNGGLLLHQLFRELLLTELQQRFSSAAVRQLYQRAADWFFQSGQDYQALQLLIDGGLTAAAAAQLSARGRQLFRQARLLELQQVLGLLPDEQIDADSDLLQLSAWLRFSLGDVNGMAVAVRRLTNLRRSRPFRAADGDDDLTALHCMVRVLSGDRDGLPAELTAAIAALSPSSHHARGWLYLFSAIIDTGDGAADPISLLQLSRQAFQHADSVLDLIYTAGLHALMLRNSLAPDQMLRLIRETLLQIESLQRPYLTADTGNYLLMMTAEIAYLRNEPAVAADALWRLRAAAGQASAFVRLETLLRLRSCAALLTLDAAQEALLAADTAQQDAWLQAVRREASPAEAALLTLLRIEHEHRCGRPERIWPLFQELAPAQPSDDAPDTIWQVYLAAHVLARRDLQRLTPLFRQQRQRTATPFRRHQYLRLTLWFCLQQAALGEQRAARELLRELLPIIEETGYRRLILDHPELAPLLKAIGSRTATALLALLREQPGAAPLLTAQQRQMLALVIDGADNARLAAEFAITVGTVKWHLNRLYRLLGVRDRRELLVRAADGSLPALE
jgi:LuxR family transcriptional regulator, maltose regulon positive regulatory protein